MFLGSTPAAFGETDGAADSRHDANCRHSLVLYTLKEYQLISQIWAADRVQLDKRSSLPDKKDNYG